MSKTKNFKFEVVNEDDDYNYTKQQRENWELLDNELKNNTGANASEKSAIAKNTADIAGLAPVLDNIVINVDDLGVEVTENKTKTSLITGTTPINFDEVLLDGDIASNTDLDKVGASAQELARLVNNGGLRHILSRYSSSDEVQVLIREFLTIIDAPIANHAKPSLAEAKAAFKMLPHYDWTKNDHFEIKDMSGGKIVKITYRGEPGATEATPGNFAFEVLTKVV